MARLPSRRSDVRGNDLDGNEIRLAHGIARKLYVCPSCRHRLEIGEEHVIVKRERDGDRFHQHWHRECARSLAREMEIAASLGRGGTG